MLAYMDCIEVRPLDVRKDDVAECKYKKLSLHEFLRKISSIISPYNEINEVTRIVCFASHTI